MATAGAFLVANATTITAVAAAYGGYQAYQTGQFNKALANAEASYQKDKAKADLARHRREVSRLIGEQRVQYAEAGVSLLSGSAMDTFTDTMTESARDAETIRVGGDIAANKARFDGVIAKRTGEAGLVSGVAQAGRTLLTQR